MAYDKLADILLSKKLLSDHVKKLSPVHQYIAFSFNGMYSRLLLSALNYKENAKRSQVGNKHGRLIFKLCFHNYKKGGCTVQPLPENQTCEYVSKLMIELTEQTVHNPDAAAAVCKDIVVPSTLCSCSNDKHRFSCNVWTKQESHKQFCFSL